MLGICNTSFSHRAYFSSCDVKALAKSVNAAPFSYTDRVFSLTFAMRHSQQNFVIARLLSVGRQQQWMFD